MSPLSWPGRAPAVLRGAADMRISMGEVWRTLAFAAALFGVLGSVTALWDNPWFVRMTPVSHWDYVILGGEALLLGLYLGLRAPACGIKQAGAGGILGFLGFGCSLCNKILVYLMGSTVLLTYFEPIRTYVGWAGLAMLAIAVYAKLARRAKWPQPQMG